MSAYRHAPAAAALPFIERELRLGARELCAAAGRDRARRRRLGVDVDGRRYLDRISAYSSLNQGHRHPRIVAALIEQARRLTLTSRAVHNDRMGPFLAKLCGLAGFEMALPMNTGAEAVETAIKLARKWGYRVKRVPQDRAEIVVCRNNFHGRTTTIVGFSSEPQYRRGLRALLRGFGCRLRRRSRNCAPRSRPSTAAFLVEPIQAEAGIIMPPDGYLRRRARSAASATCCSCSTRSRRASAVPASCSHTSTSRRRAGRLDPRQSARRRRLSGVGRARGRASHGRCSRPAITAARSAATRSRRAVGVGRARRARARSGSPSVRRCSAQATCARRSRRSRPDDRGDARPRASSSASRSPPDAHGARRLRAAARPPASSRRTRTRK